MAAGASPTVFPSRATSRTAGTGFAGQTGRGSTWLSHKRVNAWFQDYDKFDLVSLLYEDIACCATNRTPQV